MSECESSSTRRDVLVAAAAAGAATMMPVSLSAASSEVRPFHVSFPDEALADLRRRLAATKWPTKELVTDASQGVQLGTMRKLTQYWQANYNWRKVEARLNALPMFLTQIDGLDIHFIHVRSKHPNALPIIITHGWPGSVIEQLKVIGPLTDPTAHGGTPEEAFDVVIPSLPGHGLGSSAHCSRLDGLDEAAWVHEVCRPGG
jgi:hypothetical protein